MKHTLPFLFLNAEERRPRAGWRIVLFLLLFGMVTFAIGIVAVLIVGTVAGAGRGGVFSPAGLFHGLSPGGRSIGADGRMRLVPLVLSELLLTAAILLVLPLAGWFIDRREPRDFGLRFGSKWTGDFLFGFFLAAALISGIFFFELSAGLVRITGFFRSASGLPPFLPALLLALLFFVLVGIFEELLFRGYVLKNLAEGFSGRRVPPRAGIAAGLVLVSVAFGLAHVNNPNATMVSTLQIILAGFTLGIGFVLTGELAIPIGFHISWNFFMAAVYGMPVSGMDLGVSVVAIERAGDVLLTGGSFGPEAALSGLITELMGILAIVLWVRYRRGSFGFDLRIAKHERTVGDDPGSAVP